MVGRQMGKEHDDKLVTRWWVAGVENDSEKRDRNRRENVIKNEIDFERNKE
jgi:hypothetical protein